LCQDKLTVLAPARGIPSGWRCRLVANSFLSNIVNYCQDSATLFELFNSWHLYFVDMSFCHQQTEAVCFSVSLFDPKNMYVCYTGSKIKICMCAIQGLK